MPLWMFSGTFPSHSRCRATFCVQDPFSHFRTWGISDFHPINVSWAPPSILTIKNIPTDFQICHRTLKPLIQTSTHLTDKKVEAQSLHLPMITKLKVTLMLEWHVFSYYLGCIPFIPLVLGIQYVNENFPMLHQH